MSVAVLTEGPLSKPGSAARLRVLHVVYTLEVGGVEQFLLALLKASAGSTDARVLALGAAGPFAPAFAEAGFTIEALSLDGRARFTFVRALSKRFREVAPDVVQIWAYGLHPLVGLAARIARVPVVATGIQAVQRFEGANGRRNRAICALAARFTLDAEIVGAGGAAVLESLRYVPAPKLHVITNGVDLGRFTPGSSAHRAETLGAHLSDSDLVFTMVSRFDDMKDHPLVIRAFAAAARSNQDARLVLVGDGPNRAAVERQVAQLEMTDKITFLGMRADIPEILRASDGFVFAASKEGGLSVCAIEAMATGLPCVFAGIEEAVRDGVDGLSSPARDEKAFAKNLQTLVVDPDLRRRLGRSARDSALRRFSIKSTSQAFLDLYEERLGRETGPGAPA